MNLAEFKSKSTNLLISRGILPAIHDASERFAGDFLAYGWLFHCEHGDGLEMFDLLTDDNNLNDGTKFDTNFSGNLQDLIVEPLLKNKTFSNILSVLLNNKAKGVGVGELILPLLIKGWRFSNESDGLLNGTKREIKNNGASLKPVATGVTEKGIIDQLNKKYFNGVRPGQKKTHAIHARYIASLEENTRSEVYQKYFEELYPSQNVTELAKALLDNIQSVDEYNSILGKTILGWYQKVDGWNSIVIIDPDTMDIVNVSDVDSINTEDGIKLSFRSVMARGNDTQAVPHGYVNVSMTKTKTKTNKKFKQLVETKKTTEELVAEQEEKQQAIQADNTFLSFLQNETDPLTLVWRKIDRDDRVDARDEIVSMIQDGFNKSEIVEVLKQYYLN